MFVYSSAVNKARSLKEGDMVSWNSSGGKAEGKVVRVIDSGSLDIPDSSFKIKGEKDNPAVLIQLYRDGKPTDRQVGHKMSALRKSVEFDFFKHGSHNQKTHAGSRGRGLGGGGTATETDPSEKYYDAGYDDGLMESLNEQMFDIDEQFEEAAADLLDEKQISRTLDNAARDARGIRSPERINEQIKYLENAHQSSNRARGRIDDASRPVDTNELFNLHRKDVVGGINELDDAINELNRGDSSLKSLANELQGVKSTLTDYEDKLDESLLKNDAVRKHGSHNQKTHAGSRGGSRGSSGQEPKGPPPEAPSTLIGKPKVDSVINTIPKDKKDKAYQVGWMMGAMTDTESKAGDQLWRNANKWITDTINAIEKDNIPLDEGQLVETVRAVGIINGVLSDNK